MLHDNNYTANIRICQNLGVCYEGTNLFWNDRGGRLPDDGGGNLMEMKFYLILILGIFVVIGAALFYHEYMTMRSGVKSIKDENTDLKKSVDDLTGRMQKLEEANRKRMPYDAFESILDARAALNKEKEEFKFFVSLIENAEGHLDKAMTSGTKREEPKK